MNAKKKLEQKKVGAKKKLEPKNQCANHKNWLKMKLLIFSKCKFQFSNCHESNGHRKHFAIPTTADFYRSLRFYQSLQLILLTTQPTITKFGVL